MNCKPDGNSCKQMRIYVLDMGKRVEVINSAKRLTKLFIYLENEELRLYSCTDRERMNVGTIK